MRLNSLRSPIVIAVFAVSVPAQLRMDRPPVMMWKDSRFVSARPASKTPVKKALKSVKYILIRDNQAIKTSPTEVGSRGKGNGTKQPAAATAVPSETQEIGVTMWRLRPTRAAVRGIVRVTARDEKGLNKDWDVERIDPDSAFALNDKIRFAVESSQAGYLYLVDREMFADGTVGPPCLAFPEDAREDNRVEPGILFDVPSWRANPPYFLFADAPDCNPNKPRPFGSPKHVGERMTILLSATPLTVFKLGPYNRIMNPEVLERMEAASDIQIYRRKDMEDRFFTQKEADATCGPSTRGIVREKPCAESARLSPEDAAPQSIHRSRVPKDQPAVAFLPLKVIP